MRHRKKSRRFGRDSEHRIALFDNLAMALLKHERIETTVPKAKELRSFADKLVTLGKKGSLHAKRLAFASVRDHGLIQKLFDELAPRYATRNGGYTRIIRTRNRAGDAAPMSIIEFVDRPEVTPAKTAE